MSINTLLKLFLSTTLFYYALSVAFSQSPSADIDSITEDSYQRMLDRQAAEQRLDSLQTNPSHSVLIPNESIKSEWRYLIGIFIAVFLLYGLIRIKSTRSHLKK